MALHRPLKCHIIGKFKVGDLKASTSHPPRVRLRPSYLQPSFFCEVIAGLIGRITGTLTCFIDKQDNLRWSLLIDQDSRCNCTTILPKPSIYIQPFHTWKCDVYIPPDRYWFTNKPSALVDKSVWNTEKLKYLLGCPFTGKEIY